MPGIGSPGWGQEAAAELAATREALDAASRRSAELLGQAPDGSRPVRGSAWSVGEVGAHLLVGLRGFTDAVEGRYDWVAPHVVTSGTFRERLSGLTATTLTAEPERDPRALAEGVLDRTQAFLTATAGRPPDEPVATPWYGDGAELSLGAMTGLLLGEQVMHGYDVARTLGRPWPVTGPDARLVLSAATSMMPLVVDRERADLAATYEVRVNGGPHFLVRVDHGTVTVVPVGSLPVDCRLAADPAALLKVAYGRVGQWGPIARFQLRAGGRRPWLGLRFKSLFYNP